MLGTGNTAVVAAAAVMFLALVVYVQWRSWVLCRGVWPWLRWIIAFFDFWFWLPIILAAIAGLLHLLFQFLPGRPGAWVATTLLVGVNVYPVVIIGPAAALLLYKGWLLYFLSRWDPVRGQFALPAWPRHPYSRGPQKRRRREFREPLPWDRGPGSW